MKNFIQDGKTLNYVNGTGSAIASGDVVVVGKVLGIAQGDIAIGATGIVAVKGVYQVAKTTSLVITQGDKLFWNTGTAKVTKTATDKPIGIAWESQLSADTTVLVKLGASDEAGQAASIAAIGTTTNIPASTCAGGSTPTATQVQACVDATVVAIEARLDAIEAKVDATLAALKAAALMA